MGQSISHNQDLEYDSPALDIHLVECAAFLYAVVSGLRQFRNLNINARNAIVKSHQVLYENPSVLNA